MLLAESETKHYKVVFCCVSNVRKLIDLCLYYEFDAEIFTTLANV